MIRLNIQPYVCTLAQYQPPLAFKADICTRWKGILIQRFSEPYFHLFLRILTIDIVIFVDVVDLRQQIIEFGKDCNDRYWKMLIWGESLKDGAKETFACPCLLKEHQFQWK